MASPVGPVLAAAALICCLLSPNVGSASATSAVFAGLRTSPVIAEGAPTLAPMAFLRFCGKNPGECGDTIAEEKRDLTPERLAELGQVNSSVNNRIAADASLDSERSWSLGARVGNCNTYALQKRHDLLELGWPASTLSLAVVVTAGGVGHLVLVVRTQQGDIVLDNLRPDLRPWSVVGYSWRKIQSMAHPDRWTEVRSADVELTPWRLRGALMASN